MTEPTLDELMDASSQARMHGAVWDVTVLTGASMDQDDNPAPVQMKDVMEGDEVVAQWPCYGPVRLHQSGNTIDMMAPGETTPGVERGRWLTAMLDVRSMHNPVIEFAGWGCLRLEGFEARADGAMIAAVWEVTAHDS